MEVCLALFLCSVHGGSVFSRRRSFDQRALDIIPPAHSGSSGANEDMASEVIAVSVYRLVKGLNTFMCRGGNQPAVAFVRGRLRWIVQLRTCRCVLENRAARAHLSGVRNCSFPGSC